ncbi:glycosyltransferase [Acinetobacter sp. YH01009]|uniref:glycosyltransferase n=1 Tax=Acinetobacter sp. YH01009 TaxID=2601025 RepID=UPI0015D2CA19|nr:glycosyltransferase [Acinetobacter sp. YH01009]
MNRKTVYFVLDSFSEKSRGGVNRVVSQIVNELSKNHEYDVNILSFSKMEKTSFPVSDQVSLHSLEMEKFSTKKYKSIFKLLWLIFAYLKMLEFLSNKKPAFWILTSPPLIVLFSLLRMKGHRKIFCEHTSPLNIKRNKLVNKFLLKLMKRADSVISLNKKDNDFYLENGIKSTVIYNGMKFSSNFLERKKSKNFIFVGRLCEEKNPLDALSIYYKSDLYKNNYKLNFLGYGPQEHILRSKILELGLENYVSIFTNERDLNRIYGDACCLIMTSQYEGFGMVLIEAMSYGIPCISYDCPNGPRDIIQNGVNGFLVQNQDEKQFVEILKKFDFLNFNPKEVVESVSNKFNISVIVKQWENLFENIKM